MVETEKGRQRADLIGPVGGNCPPLFQSAIASAKPCSTNMASGLLSKEDGGLWELGRHCQRCLLHVSEKNEAGLGLTVRILARKSGRGIREEEKVESLP